MALKLLVIRFSSIGDIVLTSPVVRCLSTQLKDIEVHYLTKNRYAGIVESNPYIAKVFSFKKSLREVLPDLRKEHYDHIIDLHNNIRSHRVILSLMRPSKSFNKLNIEKWLMVRFKWNRLPKVHIVDRYLETVSFLGVSNDDKGLDYFIPGVDEIDVKTIYPQLFHGFAAISIGGNHNTKIMPADLVADVIKMLNLPVVLLGGMEDYERGELIRQMTGNKSVNLCGKLSLMGSASVIKQAHSVMSNDTGLMHIAAAYQKPIVSVWGNTIPEFGMYPYLDNQTPSLIAQVKNLDCRPCSKIGYKECPLKHFNCMRMQDTKKISGFINGIS
ncbi:MAG: glycosyltransferase family 9 protein [Chloroflexota bacterium]